MELFYIIDSNSGDKEVAEIIRKAVNKNKIGNKIQSDINKYINKYVDKNNLKLSMRLDDVLELIRTQFLRMILSIILAKIEVLSVFTKQFYMELKKI